MHNGNDYLETSTYFLHGRLEVFFMDTYACTICGHVYNPEKGEPAQGILAGIDFVNLPPDWQCPVCGAGKDEFEKK